MSRLFIETTRNNIGLLSKFNSFSQETLASFPGSFFLRFSMTAFMVATGSHIELPGMSGPALIVSSGYY
jgi:hypothetical protein